MPWFTGRRKNTVMEYDDEQVTENTSLVGMGPGEQWIQHDDDTVVIDQTCTPVVVVADGIKLQFKEH